MISRWDPVVTDRLDFSRRVFVDEFTSVVKKTKPYEKFKINLRL